MTTLYELRTKLPFWWLQNIGLLHIQVFIWDCWQHSHLCTEISGISSLKSTSSSFKLIRLSEDFHNELNNTIYSIVSNKCLYWFDFDVLHWLIVDIAAHKNGQTLPLIKPYTGPKLPPDRYCLSAMNYQLRTNKKPNLSYTVHNLPGNVL